MTIDEIRDNFALLDEWDDRYRYVIELGRTLEPMPEEEHSAANKVQGCASQVWLSRKIDRAGNGEPRLNYLGDSDAHIVRGLVAILLTLYSGRTPQGNSFDRRHCKVFDEFGFREHLTPQRSNGLRSMVERIRSDARARRSPPRPNLFPLTRFLHANRSTRIWSGTASLENATLLPFPLLLAEAHLLRELRTRDRVVRRDHRIVDRQPPFLAVLLRRHVVLGAQMALQRLEAFAVLQADQIFGCHRLLYRHRGLGRLERRLDRPLDDPQQRRMNLADQVREFRTPASDCC